MRVLVTGGTGMLGSSIKKIFEEDGHELSIFNSKSMDVADYKVCKEKFELINPNVVLHLAAKTNVDECELNGDDTYQTNVIGTWNIASLCKEHDILMVYISTDGVFDGTKGSYYTEYDQPKPITVYGQSKYEGEKIVQALLEKYFILRAGWMFGGAEKDFKFVGKILENSQKSNKLTVVSDKIGSPIYTKDLAVFISKIIYDKRYGLYHACNDGMCSRYEFAQKILEFANVKDVKIEPTNSSQFKTIAERPAMTPIKNYNIILQGQENLRTWQEALKEYIEEYFIKGESNEDSHNSKEVCTF
ncbi:dTDP-4-dehydrorhamnose reductase [Bacillus toyonensis]|uniref:dTDP-4-dehydrorhamnose reductase n=1 Tax=Bacillus toyonensis TaxID=155322 RepID=UPI000BF1CB05|nr:dTDP-4-dehydrorhamnose reductase [Bacillus toyonensis]PEO66121.1 dTDP-4-dehydrorhamnose reductase [Bacillus toyonensis]PFX76649.1 dTDP-4-dehydrorhamnose reductase [Bacillus toyonensis]PFX84208.1 dTDP-4-dehydrorhamnose reductase [Bacillus toyonensis]PGB17104.1 dTDP-4-dehydrorhamnose reductase [Bacillus toyonensis]PHB57874.1 dTDP-4-dehydrorhamnose reductase [Bacillus toyonensis]